MTKVYVVFAVFDLVFVFMMDDAAAGGHCILVHMEESKLIWRKDLACFDELLLRLKCFQRLFELVHTKLRCGFYSTVLFNWLTLFCRVVFPDGAHEVSSLVQCCVLLYPILTECCDLMRVLSEGNYRVLTT